MALIVGESGIEYPPSGPGGGVVRSMARIKTMKTVAVAVVSLGLLAAPAAAQLGGKGMRPTEKPADPEAAKRKAAADKAYNDALQRIPDSKEKYDPRGVVVQAAS